jgi:hypothetical protein
MELAGSMSFADADALDGVAVLSSDVIQDRLGRPAEATPSDPPDRGEAVTEFITITITETQRPGSLSGFVYADTDLNGTFDAGEIGLPNVTITLDDGTNTQVVTTGPDGWYHFEDLAAGTYSIAETQPAGYVNATNTVGTIVAAPGIPVTGSPGTVAGDVFSNIVLMVGESGINYNFGENLIPTKRMFLASTNPRLEHFTQLDVAAEFVEGTATDDTIVVQATANEIQVTVNGNPQPPVAISETKVVVVDAGTGQDTVTLIGSDEDEVAHLIPNSASLRRGTDFENLNFGVLVINAENVTANGGAGNDLAVFRDSTVDDDFMAGNGDNSAILTSADLDLIARALAFERVRAISAAGGADTAEEILPFDFELDLLGDWTLVP